jgi:hypothetical protein
MGRYAENPQIETYLSLKVQLPTESQPLAHLQTFHQNNLQIIYINSKTAHLIPQTHPEVYTLSFRKSGGKIRISSFRRHEHSDSSHWIAEKPNRDW